MLQALTSPSSLAAKTMEKYGLSLYNAQGHFIGLDGAAQQLKDHLGGLDDATRNQALGQIFGNEQITVTEAPANPVRRSNTGGASAIKN